MSAATLVPLADTAYDIGRAVGYLIAPVIIGAIILLIARSQNRSKGPAAATAQMPADPFSAESGRAPVAAPGPSPPGWYDDPWRQARLRYWDGAAWTGHTAQ